MRIEGVVETKGGQFYVWAHDCFEVNASATVEKQVDLADPDADPEEEASGYGYASHQNYKSVPGMVFGAVNDALGEPGLEDVSDEAKDQIRVWAREQLGLPILVEVGIPVDIPVLAELD
jgi:hypothetical protein